MFPGRECFVRLVADDYPDFEIKHTDEIVQYELTEADRLGRRHGDEYRLQPELESAERPIELEYFDPGAEVEAGYGPIAEQIKKKAAKNYRPRRELVVLVNLTLFDFDRIDWERIQKISEPYQYKFPSIWILWGNRLFRSWPDPKVIVDTWSDWDV